MLFPLWRGAPKHGNVRAMPARSALILRAVLGTVLALGGVVSGCEQAISLAIDVPPEDLVALAIVAADGSARALELRDRESPSLVVAEDARAYAFIVAHAELANLDGSPLPRDAALAADVRLDVDPRSSDHGSCEVCVFPSDTPPQRIVPGDSCPLPPFARVIDLLDGGRAVERTELDSLRRRILVDWPGDCP